MLAVTRLSLTDMRSHAALTLEAGAGLVVLSGPNGAGKTNVLEALSLLAPGRGLRGAALSEMARVGGAGGFAVAARLQTEGGAVELGTGAAAAAPERRLVRINGAAAPAAALGEWLSVVWLTPAMDRLFADTPGARRRFLDRLVLALEPGHGRAVLRYEAAMRARGRLLAAGSADSAWLAALEAAMAEHGAELAGNRARVVAALAETLAASPADGFPRAVIALEDASPAELAPALARSRGADAAAGRALIGPHRADLVVVNGAKDEPAARGSTGEQKALLIAILLAHAQAVRAGGRPPLLLLDEVAAHLDGERRRLLFGHLRALGAQCWLTGTDAALFEGADPVTHFSF